MRWPRAAVHRAWLLIAALSSVAIADDAPCVFRNPSDAQASPGEGYATNPIEHVGSILSIQWATSSMTNYTIALWQQSLAGGSANLGPIVFQTTEAAVTQSDWLVQLYSFRLSDSPIFFFWMREGAANLQGLSGGKACTSHYFNISSNPASSSSSSSSSASSSATSATSASSSPSSSASNQPGNTSDSSGGLSTGAQAGIGVGVGIVGVAAIAAFVVWYRYIQKKKAALDAQQAQAQYAPGSYPPPSMSAYQDGSMGYNPSSTGSPTPKPPPSEVGTSATSYPHGAAQWSGHTQPPVEMGAADRAELAS
ncbi:hypothetical protein GQ53DRAFT_832550 [Thozetella sp. PMI_491]|nr:hypothetical protein GQ53DRAFT_832550 [Thozetella sp. PMI_491]